MRTIINTLKQVLLVITMIVCSNAFSQSTAFYAFLPNAAGEIDRDGFEIGYHAIYSQWDLNNDGDISESEFHTVIFNRLDTNKNGSLSEKEWKKGGNYLFGKFLSDSRPDANRRESENEDSKSVVNRGFKQFDSNKDKKITPGEFETGIRNTGFFRSYDNNANGKLDRKELNSAVYKNMDLNGNGIIEKREFETVSKLFMD